MTKRNYTLIELLTVIFIIAVLAGLIMPATSLVRAKARRTSCSSNLKQVGALAMQFSNDRDGQIPLYYVNPPATSDSYYPLQKKEIENATRKGSIFSPMARKDVKDMYSDGKSVLWTHALVRYAKYNMNVFFCPADERRNGDYVTLNPFIMPASSDKYNDVKNDPTRSSYSMNYGYDGSGTVKQSAPGGEFKSASFMKVSQATRSPGGIPLFAETIAGRLGMNRINHSSTKNFIDNYYTEFEAKYESHRPHSKEFNYSFLDGHVDFLRILDIQALADKEGYLFSSSK